MSAQPTKGRIPPLSPVLVEAVGFYGAAYRERVRALSAARNPVLSSTQRDRARKALARAEENYLTIRADFEELLGET